MRPLLTRSAAESVYKAVIVPGIFYCSTAVLNIAETDCKKYESFQTRALKNIYRKQQKMQFDVNRKRSEIKGVYVGF